MDDSTTLSSSAKILPEHFGKIEDEEDCERRLISNVKEEEKRTYRIVILITIAIFMGYASLVLLQHRLSTKMCLESSSLYQHGCSMNYVGNLIFRIAHNFVFHKIRPRHRVYISLVSMCFSMSILGFIVISNVDYVSFVFLAYFAGGLAIGTFESNLLSSITPFGHETKMYAIVGMPAGFATISIGGFAFRTLLDDSDTSLLILYVTVAACCALACAVFYFLIPDVPIKNNSLTLREFTKNLSEHAQWFPQIRHLSLALCLNMFCVSFFSGIMFYILNDDNVVPLFGTYDHERRTMDHGWFFTIFNMFTFFGDSGSRKIVYYITKEINPLFYLIISVAGTAMCLAKLPLIAPLGIFCIFFANGAVYGTSTRFIDAHVDKKYNLISLSVWLFLGDIGSVTGSNLWEVFRPMYCRGVDAMYMCVKHNSTTTGGC